MAAPPGAEVSITYLHEHSPAPEVGDALVSEATGRTWLLVDVKPVLKGQFAGRQVRCRGVVFLSEAELPEGTKIHPLYWLRR